LYILSRNSILSVATVLTSIILGLLVAQWWGTYVATGNRVGISLDSTDLGLGIIAVAAGEPADRAGVEVGDLLVAVEGHPVDDLESLTETDSLWRRGVPLRLALIRDGRPIEVVPVPGSSFPWFVVLTATLSCLAYLAVGLIAFGQAPNDIRIRLLFFFSAAVALEFALPRELGIVPAWASIQLVVFYLVTGAQAGLELHLASVIPRPARWLEKTRWLPAGYYVLGIGMGVVAVLSLAARAAAVEVFPFSNGILLFLIDRLGLLVWSVLVAGILVYQVVNATDRRARQQAMLVLIGVLPWTVFQVAYPLIVAAGDAPLPWMNIVQPLVLLAYPVAVFIAIIRFNLLDIDVVLRRSLVFILVTATLVVLFTTAFGLGNVVFSNSGDPSAVSVVALSLGMLVLGLLFAPIRRRIQLVVDRRFFPESQEMAQRLTDLTAELPTLGSLPAMGRRLVDEIVKVFEVSNVTLLVADPVSGLLMTLASSSVDPDRRFGKTILIEPDDPGLVRLQKAGHPLPAEKLAGESPVLAQRLHAFDAELVAGLTSGANLTGLLLIGPKTGGERVQSSDIEILNLFSHAAATVFENARLFESATYESLTGLMRREVIIEKLTAELQRSSRYKRPLSVGMVDIDRFKRVNDNYGHLVGDAMLKHVAHTLKAELRATDSIGRYGGEEFLFILPETDIDEGSVVAEKLRAAIDNLESPLEEAPDARVTVSVGLSAVDHDDTEAPTATKLILGADLALLEAKRAGRNRVITGPEAA
jgi:diguanylate cyclase (GGDEF)-like protein